MRKRVYFAIAATLGALVLNAQTIRIQGRYPAGNAEQLALHVRPLDGALSADGVALKAADKTFEGDAPVSSNGFYQLYGRNGNVQLLMPVYLSGTNAAHPLTLQLEQGCPMITDAGDDNKALSAFNKKLWASDRFFWTQGKTLKAEELLPFLRSYQDAVDSLTQVYACSEPVKQYLRLWAYTSAWNSYESIPRAVGIALDQLSFTSKDLYEEPLRILDTPLAVCFSSASYIIFQMLPAGTMNERLAALHDRISNEDMRRKVGNVIADNFVRRFNYGNDFEAGLAELKEAVSTYGVDSELVEEFTRRRTSVKGSPFPEGVILVDADGKEMDMATFKGSYVYVDLWASWCGPCCKEVPFLQQLEKDLQNDNVKFVSISLDSDEKAWKNKMQTLNMHGNQWGDKNEALAHALNVQGIPRFLIYDKEGRLYDANALRPSHPNILEYLGKLE
ncbi:MAG: TlpA family protein disulfide reductase [Bacteroidaceae bacterium]|nr:TlpA family protein disulfide reductase [Bacteroidaceae bacterium]